MRALYLCFVVFTLLRLDVATAKTEKGSLACTVSNKAKGLQCLKEMTIQRELTSTGDWVDLQLSSNSKAAITETRGCLPGPEDPTGSEQVGKWYCKDMKFFTSNAIIRGTSATGVGGVMFDQICPYTFPGYDTIFAYSFDISQDKDTIVLKTDTSADGPWKPVEVARCKVVSGTVFGVQGKPSPPSPPAPTCKNVRGKYEQCGGKKYCPKGQKNCVGPWKGYCCHKGWTCVRSDDWYSQCRPVNN